MKGIVFTVRRNKNAGKSSAKFDFKYYFKRYGIYIMLLSFLAAGIAAGAAFARRASFTAFISSFFGADVFINSNSGAVEIFAAQLAASFGLILIFFLLGVCAVGTPFLPFAFAFKGLGTGAFVAALASDFGIKGALFYLLTCFLGDAVLVAALLSECARALRLSLKLSRLLFFNNAGGTYASGDIKDFVIHSSYMLALTAVSAAINTVLHFVFAGLCAAS